MIGFSWTYSLSLPRLEHYREHLWNVYFKFVYDGLMDEFKMHLLDKKECPWYDTDKSKINEKMKNPLVFESSFSPCGAPALLQFCECNRMKNPVDTQRNHSGAQKTDFGVPGTRDKWVNEDPQREKQIYDVSFSALTKDPIGETKKIYKYFGME
ncbi:hypothetical protein EIN_394610 [Entamoeba invadens IP1]|uniref:Uncharacterized protein n=1 Tax=Entamoeba invadens IP1 TaxID=370355 RepID=L7FMB0_ENTIV|nr:hypothetical protein EIN_394610 [Entamoeba invadens IP1]ELP90244.1 hypothetical protein EIN_394610 [Entamoeba invadens IP1]|eukprot:XP_004257015.1 hypothetical protein EIN_394610 [Entamoeba invadens IP1]